MPCAGGRAVRRGTMKKGVGVMARGRNAALWARITLVLGLSFGLGVGVQAGKGGPDLELKAPANGAMLMASELKTIEGKVADLSGMGIAWVGYSLVRQDGSLEWDGMGQWVPGPTGGWLMAKVDGRDWKVSASLMPSAAQLLPGIYLITAHAADRDGNTSDAQALITIQPEVLIP
jgi:hypothetical protein